MFVRDFTLRWTISIRNTGKDSFCPDSTLSDRIFLYFLQGVHRQISRSGDFDLEQATRVMLEEQLWQDIEDFRMPLWNKKSLACSSVSVIACISLCRE